MYFCENNIFFEYFCNMNCFSSENHDDDEFECEEAPFARTLTESDIAAMPGSQSSGSIHYTSFNTFDDLGNWAT